MGCWFGFDRKAAANVSGNTEESLEIDAVVTCPVDGVLLKVHATFHRFSWLAVTQFFAIFLSVLMLKMIPTVWAYNQLMTLRKTQASFSLQTCVTTLPRLSYRKGEYKNGSVTSFEERTALQNMQWTPFWSYRGFQNVVPY